MIEARKNEVFYIDKMLHLSLFRTEATMYSPVVTLVAVLPGTFVGV